MQVIIDCGKNFSFQATVLSHGWYELPPFKYDPANSQLEYTFDQYNKIKMSPKSDSGIIIDSESQITDETELAVRRILRLDEDYDEFYKLAERAPGFNWIKSIKAGRLLRAPSLWEDMVKILCTTNCSWSLTRSMTSNLVEIFGNGSSFPDAAKIAEVDENFIREKIKMGYRSPYLLELAQKITSGAICLEDFYNWQQGQSTLYKKLNELKGFGHYAVSSLMKTLGYYQELSLDSWNRAKFYKRHNNDKPCPDNEIIQFYRKFGQWAGLFFWMDVTKEFYKTPNFSN